MKKFLTATMAAIMAFGALALTSCDTANDVLQTPNATESSMSSNRGEFIVGESNGANGISLLSTAINSSDFATYNIPQNAESAVLVTATVQPESATNHVNLNWEARWKTPSSVWANGKTVSDYVTVTKAGNLTATVTCLQAFGEQVEIVCSVAVPGVTLSDKITCDYMARPRMINWKIAGAAAALGTEDVWCRGIFKKGETPTFNISHNFSNDDYAGFDYRSAIFGGMSEVKGTGTLSTSYFKLTVQLWQDFCDALMEYGFTVRQNSYTYEGENFNATFNDPWFIYPCASQGVEECFDEMMRNGCVSLDTLEAGHEEYENYRSAVSEVDHVLELTLSLTNADGSIVYEEYTAKGQIDVETMFPDLVAEINDLQLDGDITF